MLGNWSDSLDHLIHLLVAFVLALPIGWNRARAEQGAGLRTLDRKSTRLNSSHSQISYAVFCLKKKHAVHGLRALCSRRLAPPSHRPLDLRAPGLRRRPTRLLPPDGALPPSRTSGIDSPSDQCS